MGYIICMFPHVIPSPRLIGTETEPNTDLDLFGLKLFLKSLNVLWLCLPEPPSFEILITSRWFAPSATAALASLAAFAAGIKPHSTSLMGSSASSLFAELAVDTPEIGTRAVDVEEVLA